MPCGTAGELLDARTIDRIAARRAGGPGARRGLERRVAAQPLRELCAQRRQLGGLGEIVVHPRIHALIERLAVRIGGKGDHRRLALVSLILLGADGARERVAVHLGHLQVGDHEVVAFAAPLGERLEAAARGVGFQAQDLQLALEHGEVDRMVVDDQQLGAGRCGERDRSAHAARGLLLVANRAGARLLGGERHRNARAQAFGAGDLDRAAHQLDQLARDGEPEAGAAVAAAGLGFALLERLEQAPLRLGAHADAGIVHAEAEFLAPFGRLQHLHLQG